MNGLTSPSGAVALRVIPRVPAAFGARVPDMLRYGLPHFGLSREVFVWRLKNLPHFWRGFWRLLAARVLGVPHVYGAVWLRVIRRDGSITDLGLASLRVVTTAGVNFIVDAFQNTTELENLKYHGIGTGSTAEAAGDTALVTELTTQYNPDSTRATGSLTEGASANIFRTVGTNTVDSAVTIQEHGIFSQSATGGGTLLDRSVFTGVALASGDSLQTTYDLTVNSGG